MAEGERELVRFEKDGGIGVITVDNPPVNALSPGVPEGITAAIDKGNADPAVKAMVLIGAGRSFIAGADIRQFGRGPATPPPTRRHYDVIGPEPQTGCRGDPRLCARRRSRNRARLPLPGRGAERQGRAAGSADRHPARRRRHAAPAAPHRPEGGARDDHLRPACPGRGGAQARHHRRDRAGRRQLQGSRDRLRPQDRRQAPAAGHPRHATTSSPRARPIPHVRRLPQIDRAPRPQPARALCLHRGGRGGGQAAVRRGLSRSSANCSTSRSIPTRRRRCATPSSPSARSQKLPDHPARHASCARPTTAAVVGAGTMGGGIAMSFADYGYST